MKILIGKVLRTNNNKTVSVLIKRIFKIPIYNKISLKKKKYHVHDELNMARVGDLVCILLCKPFSKHKVWKIIKFL